MIDRSYLPFKSARKYVDRGMAKWMGFFISEHRTALEAEDETIDYSKKMPEEDLRLLLGQAYRNSLDLKLYTNLRPDSYIGRVQEIYKDTIYFRSEGQVQAINFSSIIHLELFQGENLA